MNVLIIGGNGQLGSDLELLLKDNGYSCTSVGSSDLDLTEKDFEKFFIDKNYNIIINTSAYHNLELCEENKQLAFDINASPLYKLSHLANSLNSILIHFSTDYVFDGNTKSPYKETDQPNPLNIYGQTKLLGEKIVQQICKKYYVIRTSGLYGKHPCRGKGKNFVDLMLHLSETNKTLKVVNDEKLSPTNTRSLSYQVERILDVKAPYGLYHAVSEGSCTWYEFANEIFRIKSIDINVNIAGPNDFPKKTPRPSYSSLKNYKLDKLGFNFMPTWQEGLVEYLKT